MTWWMIVLLVFAVLFLIGCIPIGLDAQYQDGTCSLRAKIGPFWLGRIPRRKKRKGTAAAAEKPDAPAKKTLLTLPAGSASETWELLRFLSDVLGDLRRKIRLNELTLHVRFGAGDDAAKTAIRYGRAWAIIGVVMPHLERIFVIKKRDIGAELDYNVDEKMAADAHMVLTITIGRALALALRAGIGFLKIYQAYQDKNKGGAVHESSSE